MNEQGITVLTDASLITCIVQRGRADNCVTAMREGDVEYLKPPNNHPDKGTCLTCIAVPKSNLTLDA